MYASRKRAAEPDETGPSIKGTSKKQGRSGGRPPNEVVGTMTIMNGKLDEAMSASGTERIILMDSIVLVLSACITPTKLAKHGSAQSTAACGIFATKFSAVCGKISSVAEVYDSAGTELYKLINNPADSIQLICTLAPVSDCTLTQAKAKLNISFEDDAPADPSAPLIKDFEIIIGILRDNQTRDEEWRDYVTKEFDCLKRENQVSKCARAAYNLMRLNR